MQDDQQEIIAFLSDPSSYGDAATAEVERHDTHISRVFLAGARAFKLKRAVRYPYLDFSTVENRRTACEAELVLNRRTAPELYLEVRAIRRGAEGGLAWGEDGTIVDWVVVMRRFPQDRLLDAVAKSGELSPPLLYALAAHIADFHATALVRPNRGGAAAMVEIVLENDECLRACRKLRFADRKVRELHDRSTDLLTRLTPLLDRRRAARKVRRCHGDLHLRNICVLDGKPVLFDCLEFADEFASIDVLYDLAFLLMDLDHRGHAQAANLVLNRYLDLTGEDDGLAAMPLFLSLRAAIRAHITASALDSSGAYGGEAAEARRYLDQACAAVRPASLRLIAIGGLSGTGKSTLAAELAAELGVRPGARVLRSDVVRKRLFGLAPEARLPERAYAPDVTDQVYRTLRDRAGAALRAGYCAVIDAVALLPAERRSFAEVAHQAGVPFGGLWLEARAETLTMRVDARSNDASDATRKIVHHQLRVDPGPIDWRRIDAEGDVPITLATARQVLGLI
jgi:aminoglycoside phosphotransferase family enzyme/predicted kinase